MSGRGILRRPWRRLGSDRRGVSAVEFAMLAPVMIFFYFGLAEFCQGYMAQKRASHSAAMVADLIAQRERISNREIDDIFEIGELIMAPFTASGMSLRVSSARRIDANTVRIDWSRGRGMTARTTGSTITVPAGLIGIGESVVMAESLYDYDSPVDYMMPGITTFSHTFYLRPRTVERVALVP
ncbi:MAG: pilus assembly protein [Brevundimonas sp.]|uniref:TadE/TadG family type IV pilus assembly protein n=1 Tax=Brevundimonas sp. TaxID=1871086 RepID=UPI0027344541|nr:TadE/TadG family type IV pilus assembly protein [Brevundimonas sp.]MDP3379520.1 pilus assembly protein [Brevundimonas sp.]